MIFKFDPLSKGKWRWTFWAWLLVISQDALTVTSGNDQSQQITIKVPANRLVFQRDSTGGANIPLKISCPTPGATVEAGLTRVGEVKEKLISLPGQFSAKGEFSGMVRAAAGWYSLRVRASKEGMVIAEQTVERVGVGEVFIVMGHSVAQGGDLNLPGAADDRVQTIALSDEQARFYERSANPKDLPQPKGQHFASEIRPAPFGHGPYFWARFAEELVTREDVPVLLLNAGFGGTALEHWAKSSHGESFQHSFVRSDLQMPYANLRNALEKYAVLLGLRAILSDHGQNDAPENRAEVIFKNYRDVIAQARSDLKFPDLAVVVNRQTPYGTKRHVREVQERVIREVPQCYAGPDYDVFTPGDRPDGIHLGISGMEKAAKLWAEAVDQRFFKQSKPFIP